MKKNRLCVCLSIVYDYYNSIVIGYLASKPWWGVVTRTYEYCTLNDNWTLHGRMWRYKTTDRLCLFNQFSYSGRTHLEETLSQIFCTFLVLHTKKHNRKWDSRWANLYSLIILYCTYVCTSQYYLYTFV